MTATLHSTSTIAEALNMTENRIKQLAKNGILPKADKGKYNLKNSVHEYIRYLRNKA